MGLIRLCNTTAKQKIHTFLLCSGSLQISLVVVHKEKVIRNTRGVSRPKEKMP